VAGAPDASKVGSHTYISIIA